MKFSEHLQKFNLSFTEHIKGFFSIGAVAFAVLWVILWINFPMEWYSLFFMSVFGSYFLLAILAFIIQIIFNWLFSVISASNISVTANTAVNLIFLVGSAFLFANFRFRAVYFFIAAVIAYAVAMFFIFGTAVPLKKKKIKRLNSKSVSHTTIITSKGQKHAVEEYDADFIPIKKQPLACAVRAVLYVIFTETAYLFLFWKIMKIFTS